METDRDRHGVSVKQPPRISERVFNNAGGAMGAMYIIHASIIEYLIVFGTPLGIEGHSGTYPGDNYFNILVGEQWAFYPGELEKRVYRPGMVNHLPRGKNIQYKMHKGCFALEYQRGWIPPMLPFGFGDTFTLTLDFEVLWRTVKWTDFCLIIEYQSLLGDSTCDSGSGTVIRAISQILDAHAGEGKRRTGSEKQ
ncbi:c-8 sterol isomerase [Moniliophthora roreri MCA 2997]|uniref:C-8 sterol isomerase n=1 Tax=Moniliophthora roreri (strain MCA 2997) TaxID=1381753 RepID=V2WBE0_MONRO|nr:c-8 sterol isomerase [Moniliophthora roreri MCA 2997]